MRLVKIRHHAAWVAVLVALTLVVVPGQAQTPVVVRIAPASAQVAAGGTVDVAVEVVNVQELYGFDVTVTFDPQVVEVVDADPNTPGIQVAQGLFLDAGFAVANTADNTAGSVHFLTTQLNPSLAKSGTGSLVVIKLRGKKVGATSSLTIANSQLARRDGFMIPSTGIPGEVAVTSGEGPTNTPMPTQGAGTPMATATPEPTALPTATPPPTSVPPTATATLAAAPPSVTVAAPGVTTTTVPSATWTPETPVATATAVPASATPAATRAPIVGLTAAPTEQGSPSMTPEPTRAAPAEPTEVPQGNAETGEAGVNLWLALGAGALTVLLGAGAYGLWSLRCRSAPR